MSFLIEVSVEENHGCKKSWKEELVEKKRRLRMKIICHTFRKRDQQIREVAETQEREHNMWSKGENFT